MSIKFDFVQAVHAANSCRIKYEQELIQLNKKWESVMDLMDEFRENKEVFIKLKAEKLKLDKDIQEAEYYRNYYQRSYEEGCALV